jgi:hypothetical protein
MDLTPQQRSLRARLAAYSRWAVDPNRQEATKPARKAWAQRFEREVDPEQKLAPEERQRRAHSAMKARMLSLSLRSSRRRQQRRARHFDA